MRAFFIFRITFKSNFDLRIGRMKRAKAKSIRAKSKTPRGKNAGKPVDLATIREQISSLVGGHAVGMVETTIDEVDKGHYLAMKFLFELIGLYPVSGEEEESPVADSMAKTLLRRLQLPEEPAMETSVTKDRELDSPATESDTVK